MSLPLDSDTSEDSLGDSKIGRRMDLALCKSPLESTIPTLIATLPNATVMSLNISLSFFRNPSTHSKFAVHH